MPNLVGPEYGTLAELRSDVSHELMIVPKIKSQNPIIPSPFGGPGRSFLKHYAQRRKVKMLRLDAGEDVLIPDAACSVWNPTTKSYLTNDTILPVYSEVNEQWCPKDFQAVCQEVITMNPESVASVLTSAMGQGVEIDPIMAAAIVALQKEIGNSLFKVAYFADPNFGTGSYAHVGQYNLDAKHSVAEKTRLTAMLNRQEGFTALMRRLVGEGKIAYINTNDGSYTGNATVAANIADFLDDMIAASSPELQYGEYTEGQVKGVFKLQGGLFKAFKAYMKSVSGSEANWSFIVNGTAVPGMYMYDGYVVMHWADKDLFDNKIGLFDPTLKMSKSQEAILTVPENLALLTHVRGSGAGLDDDGNAETADAPGLVIQRSPDIRDKGALFALAQIGIGVGITQRSLVTYGYNSAYTYDVTP